VHQKCFTCCIALLPSHTGHSSCLTHSSKIGSHSITNSDLSDIQWFQARLPVKDGGLRVKHVSLHTLPAFFGISSEHTLPPGGLTVHAQIVSYYRHISQSGRPRVVSLKQPFWDHPGISIDNAIMKSSLSERSFWLHYLNRAVIGSSSCQQHLATEGLMIKW